MGPNRAGLQLPGLGAKVLPSAMLPEIGSRLGKLEQRRVALVNRVRALSPEQRNMRRDKNAFTAAEVVEHFALIEHFNCVFLDRAEPKTLHGQKVALRLIGKMAIKGMQDTAKGVQTLPQAVPTGTLILEESAERWEGARRKLGVYLEQVTDPDAAFIKMMWLFGTLSAKMYLDLVEIHMTYHEARFPSF